MENGTTATGVINSILTNTNRGVVVIDVTVSGVTHQEYINICKIAYFTILETTYNTSIRYLAGPVQPTVCGCVESIDSLISVGDSVEISAAGNTLDTAEVVAVGYCIIALMLGTTIVFVSAKEIEIFLIVSENGG